jgi:hypothetical protein
MYLYLIMNDFFKPNQYNSQTTIDNMVISDS